MSMKSTIVMDININNEEDLSMFGTFINILFMNSEAKDPLFIFKVETTEIVKREGWAHLEVRVSSTDDNKSLFMKQINDLFLSFRLNTTRKKQYFEFEDEQINDIGN